MSTANIGKPNIVNGLFHLPWHWYLEETWDWSTVSFFFFLKMYKISITTDKRLIFLYFCVDDRKIDLNLIFSVDVHVPEYISATIM